MDILFDTWHSECVSELNATAAALLGLLHEESMTGGQLVAAAAERFGGFFSVTRSQVYRELPVLADAGLLKLGSTGARSSQQYAITPAGKKAFKNWLASTSGSEQLRSPLILRLVHAGALTPKQRGDLITGARETYNSQLSDAKAAAKAADDLYAQAAADFALAHAKAMLKLLDSIS